MFRAKKENYFNLTNFWLFTGHRLVGYGSKKNTAIWETKRRGERWMKLDPVKKIKVLDLISLVTL
jgi:hypothetical protein